MVQQWLRTTVFMLALFVPLGLGVLWVASKERVLQTPLAWNSDAQAVCVLDEPCNAGVVSIRAAASRVHGSAASRGEPAEVPVDANLLLSAGHFLPTHAQRDDYYARHRTLDALLQADKVELVMAGGSTRDVVVGDRGWNGIGFMLWLHVLFAALAWASGMAHAVLRPQTGSYFLALSCAGYAVGMSLGGLELVHGVAWPLGGGLSGSTARRGARCNLRLQGIWALFFACLSGLCRFGPCRCFRCWPWVWCVLINGAWPQRRFGVIRRSWWCGV